MLKITRINKIVAGLSQCSQYLDLIRLQAVQEKTLVSRIESAQNILNENSTLKIEENSIKGKLVQYWNNWQNMWSDWNNWYNY